MKPSRLLLLLTAIVSPAALLICGCTKTDSTATPADQVKAGAADVASSASDSWDSIKDYAYDKRVEFSASVSRMAKRSDDETDQLKAKMTATSSSDRASAMKDYDDARADLKAKLTALDHATADTWADAKDKVAQAWKHVQATYDKLTSTT
jgi:hypothetical protein